jgi:hypothetical protein
MTITVGTDSFVSIDDADAYMAARIHADAWPDHGPIDGGQNSVGETEYVEVDPRVLDRKERALKTATQILNRESYTGRITSTAQPLAWPRAGVCDAEGRPVASDTIPTNVSLATTELALFLLKHDMTDEVIRRWLFRLRSEAVGESQASYDSSAPDNLPHIVRSLIAPFMKAAGSNTTSLIA